MEQLSLIDTHAHLDFDKFQGELDQLLARAKEAGVEQIVTIGASRGYDSNLRALALAQAHPQLFATLGVHPHDAEIVTEEMVEELGRLAQAHPKVVAIGETGLDYHYDRSPRDAQRWAFARFIALARRLHQPIIVHTREAEADTVQILQNEGAQEVGGILHCFSGTAWLAERCLALGFYVSFSGIVTFRTAQEIQEVARHVPLDRILIETDAPYLAPMPLRGKRNEPAFVAHTLRFLAQLRGEDPAALARATTQNARRLYRLPSP